MFFRFLVLFFTIATIVLSSWALVGSWKNEPYLTNNYLLSFQLSNLNVSALLKDAVDQNMRRDFVPVEIQDVDFKPTPTSPIAPAITDAAAQIEKKDLGQLTSLLASVTTLAPSQLLSRATELASLTSQLSIQTSDLPNLIQSADPTKIVSELQQIASSLSLPPSLATLAAGFNGDTEDLINRIAANTNASQLGLADMYNIGFWGYCKGDIHGIREQIPELGSFGTQFSNKDVNYTYCTPPKVGYTFDPLQVLKTDIIDHIQQTAQETASGPLASITNALAAQVVGLVNLITYETIGLPGDLQNAIPLLGRLTNAGFALILAGAALAFISLIFQLVGMCCSPDNLFLSCCNFFVMVLTLIVVTVGSGLTTGVFIYVRRILNDEIKKYGVKPYLSVQMYAFSWSAVVAALCLVVFSILGYCCGCFKSDRRRKRQEPEFRYDHKM
ncbi:hypothetical protein PUMCH_003867 [Australozyma saopauloensis]|uniref:SUR7 family protein pun1 n=1 Tax=Australozyma saopauloensis TaxID=291208 RepID=A0AAX4HDY4_9ASCO|nr:hypothetical protein PUMCH_003867 [[Candida] saopauloensis]